MNDITVLFVVLLPRWQLSTHSETIVWHSENGPIHTWVNVLQRQHFFVVTPHKMAPEPKLLMEDSIQKIKTMESFDMGQCRHLNYLCVYIFFFITTD